MNSTIEKVIKYFPLGTFLLIVGSSFKHYLYYLWFGINITDFLELSEYIPLFVDDLIIILIILIAIIASVTFPSNVADEEPIKEKKYKSLEHANRSKLKNKIIIYSTFFSIIVITHLYLSYGLDKIIYSVLILGLTILMLAIVIINSNMNNNLTFFRVKLLTLIVILASIFYYARIEYLWFIQMNYDSYVIKTKTIDSEISEYKYISKSKNYIYLYNLNKKEAMIIPSEELLLLKSKR